MGNASRDTLPVLRSISLVGFTHIWVVETQYKLIGWSIPANHMEDFIVHNTTPQRTQTNSYSNILYSQLFFDIMLPKILLK